MMAVCLSFVLTLGAVGCDDEATGETNVRGGEAAAAPKAEAPGEKPAETPAETTDNKTATDTPATEPAPIEPEPDTPASSKHGLSAKAVCVRGATSAVFSDTMHGRWVDAADPRRRLNVTSTGISKVPGPQGSAVRSSVNLIAGRRSADHLTIVRCASLVTTSMGTGSDQCRGSVEIERDMLTVSLTGHRACAEDLSGVFIRKDSSWTTEVAQSKGKAVYDARQDEIAEFISRSEIRCNGGTGKIRVPSGMRGVWYNDLAEDGTPRALLAVTATGLARSSGPAGDGRTASLLAYDTADDVGSLTINCGDVATDATYEYGRYCTGTVGLAGDALTVDVTGRNACTQLLSGTWKRWHGTEVTRRPAQASVSAPVAVDDTPAGPIGLPRDASPCKRVLNTTWRNTIALEAPSYKMDRSDFAVSVTKDAVALHLVSQKNPRTSLRHVRFEASRVAPRGNACVYTVRQAVKNGPFEMYESNPYDVVSEVLVTPLADGIKVGVLHGRTAAAACRGNGCTRAGRYPESFQARFNSTLASLNDSIWWTPESDIKPLAPVDLTIGYAAGHGPIGVSAGPECEQLFDSMWVSDAAAGHGGAAWDAVKRNGLLLRREGVELHQTDAAGRTSGVWTRFNAVPESRHGACTWSVHDVSRAAAFDGDLKLVSTPWSTIRKVSVRSQGGDVKVTLEGDPVSKSTCVGESCARGRYPRKFVPTFDGWVSALNRSVLRPVPADTASYDGRPTGYGLARPETGTPSHPAAPPSPAPRVGEAPATASRVARGMALGQEWDMEWVPKKADAIVVRITSPVPDEIISSGTLNLRVNVDGFKAFKGDHGGNHLRVLLDNEAPRDWYDPNERPFTVDGLSQGLHSVRIFPVTPWGESIKGKNAFAKVSFYVRSTKDAPVPLDWTRPTLSYSHPAGTYSGAAAHRILMDFFLTNIVLSPAGYRVRMQLDDHEAVDIVTWGPLWLENMPAGQHRISMSLINKRGQIVPGPFNQIERSFTVETK